MASCAGLAESMVEPTRENWQAVDEHLAEMLVGVDDGLEAALRAQHAADMPDIEVAPLAGKFLHLLARISGARRVLEVGTLGGYSTIWLARAVGDGGEVTTIEAEPANAAVARASIDAAGVGERVEILIGRAAEVLTALEGPFDLVFIDADKESNTIYLEQAARLGRAGTVIVLDNVVRDGEIIRPDTTNSQILGVQAGLRMLADDPRFDATALQTVGLKGWDGIALAVLR